MEEDTGAEAGLECKKDREAGLDAVARIVEAYLKGSSLGRLLSNFT